ncbi:MAG: ABC transporter permease [Eubacterium sp.]|nr:ABC transporter permease [Eubacterium sp.]
MRQRCRELYEYREMIRSMVRRDLRGRYKSSVLGFLWTFINPLCQIAVYTVVFSRIFRMGIDRYYLFLTVVMVPWVCFSASVQGGAVAVVNQQDLVKKIYFPREVLPISYVTGCFINMLLSFVVVFVLIAVSGSGFSLRAFLFLPAVILAQYLLCLGAALIISACTVYLRDLEHIAGVLLMAWIYLTPVMYDISFIPKDLALLFYINPMTPIAAAYRDILYYKQAPQMSGLLLSLCTALAVLLMGEAVFAGLQKNFAEEL